MWYDGLTEGLLQRGPRRRRRRRLLAAAIVGVAALAVLLGLPERGAEREASAGVTSDRIRELTAPELPVVGTSVVAAGSGAAIAGTTSIPRPSHAEGEIEPGESLSVALVRSGVPRSAIGVPVARLGEIFDFRRSQVGDQFEVDLDHEGEITRLRYQTSPETIFEAVRTAGHYEARRVDVPLDREVNAFGAAVRSSLYGAIEDAGESTVLAGRLVDIFQWDIDFSSEVRRGDAFRVIYEKVYLDGELLRYGRILAAEYLGSTVNAVAYYFDEEGHEGYYDADGTPLERMFLRAPLRYRAITSGFTERRFHPILREYRPHYGVDYSADTGTPIWSVADGVVTFSGRRGPNGNLVRIRHENGYESVYAHLHSFARGMRRGKEVQQGDLIGTVGSTGRSTGPHLQFGMKKRGDWIDPMDVRNEAGPALRGRLLRAFRRRQQQLRGELDDIVLPVVELEPEGSGDQPGDDEPLATDFGFEDY